MFSLLESIISATTDGLISRLELIISAAMNWLINRPESIISAMINSIRAARHGVDALYRLSRWLSMFMVVDRKCPFGKRSLLTFGHFSGTSRTRHYSTPNLCDLFIRQQLHPTNHSWSYMFEDGQINSNSEARWYGKLCAACNQKRG